MEAFYQLEWDQTIIDNCGTFFASNDVAADGCDNNYTVLSAAQRDGILGAGATIEQLNALIGQDYYAGLDELGITIGPEGVTVPRGGDRDARDSGQYGLAFRWLADAAEYGLYFMNYHSRTPTVGYKNASAAEIGALLGLLGTPAPGGPLPPGAAFGALASPALLSNGEYFLEYPEDIRLYGASFATTLPTGTAWSGEISYRPNLPVSLNSTYTTGLLATGIGAAIGAGDVAGAIGQAGLEHRGYNRKEVTQIQTTFTHFFDQVLGAGRVTVVGEVGFAHVGGLESKSDLRYGRDSIYGLDTPEYGNDGFVTANSWGYRLRALADYSNVFAGVNLTPNVSFSHDVHGYGPNGLFNEGSKAVSVGVDAVYQNSYTASLSYTDFFGGDYNTLVDRDFLALSVGVNF